MDPQATEARAKSAATLATNFFMETSHFGHTRPLSPRTCPPKTDLIRAKKHDRFYPPPDRGRPFPTPPEGLRTPLRSATSAKRLGTSSFSRRPHPQRAPFECPARGAMVLMVAGWGLLRGERRRGSERSAVAVACVAGRVIALKRGLLEVERSSGNRATAPCEFVAPLDRETHRRPRPSQQEAPSHSL